RLRDRAGSIMDLVRAIEAPDRSPLEARLNACTSKPIRKLLRKVLVEPINAGIRVPAGTMLHPSLNDVPVELASHFVLAPRWNWWHWHGQPVPQNLIDSPATIKIKRIDAERRLELQRVMLERYREGRYRRRRVPALSGSTMSRALGRCGGAISRTISRSWY